MHRLAGGNVVVELVKDEMIEMIAKIDVSRVRRTFLERPTSRNERGVIERLVDLLPELEERSGRDVGHDIRSFFGEVEARGVAGDIEGRGSLAEADRPGSGWRNDACVMAFGAEGYVAGNASAALDENEVRNLRLA